MLYRCCTEKSTMGAALLAMAMSPVRWGAAVALPTLGEPKGRNMAAFTGQLPKVSRKPHKVKISSQGGNFETDVNHKNQTTVSNPVGTPGLGGNGGVLAAVLTEAYHSDADRWARINEASGV